MAQRIHIAADQFKVSRPGFDVSTATEEQLAFNGLTSRYGAVYLAGVSTIDSTWSSDTVTVNAGSFNQGVIYFTRRRKVIPLGKTFAQPPQVIYMLRQTSNPSAGAVPRYSYIDSATNGAIGSVFWASTTTTDLILRLDYPTAGSGSGIKDFDVSYMVFQT